MFPKRAEDREADNARSKRQKTLTSTRRRHSLRKTFPAKSRTHLVRNKKRAIIDLHRE